MPEYIEREALIEFVKQNTPHFDGETTMECVERAIRYAPTADVAEVVRCSQCVNLRASSDGAYCNRLSSTWDKCYVRFDDYCSYGEKR